MINLVFEQEFSTDCRSDFGKYFCKIKIWYISWSGRRDSNPRLQPWQGCALPLSYARRKRNYLINLLFEAIKKNKKIKRQ